MATDSVGQVIQSLRQAMLRHDGAGLTDGQLLDVFIERREEAAFAALVRRHGPMVWGVCLRVLRNHHDAEDAFQATFLVLVRKAASIRPREMVANWLYGVARQTALKARATINKRRMREKQGAEIPEPATAEQDCWNDLRHLLDQELSRLPDKYRVAVVLCDLECKTRKEVARQLGLPEGTVASRLATARTMLAKRLARHGLGMGAGSLAAALSEKAAPACMPVSVVNSTIDAARLFVLGQATTSGMISAKVTALTNGVLRIMFLKTLKTLTAGALLLSMATITSTMVAGGKSDAPSEPAVNAAEEPQEEAGKADPSKAKPAEDNAVQNELQKLQGTWLLVSAEENGSSVPQEKIKKMELTLTIKNDRFTLKTVDGREMHTLAASGRELLTLKSHTDAVLSVFWSQDGKRLITGSADGTAKVWETASGRELLALKGHPGAVMSGSWSPDGRFLATGSADGTVMVWDAASGRELLSLKGHVCKVRSITWSPDGKFLATGSEEGTAKIWNSANGRELLSLKGHLSTVWSLAWSPDSKRLTTGSEEGRAIVWELSRYGEVLALNKMLTLTGHSNRILAISWSPDGKRLATGSADRTAKVWDTASGQELFSLDAHGNEVQSVAWSPDGESLATGNTDGTAKIWDAKSGRELLCLKGHSVWAWSVSWSPDGKRLATGSADGTAKVWQVSRSPLGAVGSVSFSPDGKRATTVGADGTVREWEATGQTETLKGKLSINPTKQPKMMDWSALKPEDEKRLNLKGIYAIDGDTLKFCYGEPQPTEFKTKPNRQPNEAPLPNLDQRMFVFKREKR
jgi:RNA polymerase sigma factor (sigma-70 family)